MKQNLFIMGLAIAALSSCSQNDVLDIPESRTIQFANTYVGSPTRAASVIDNDNFKSFYVFGGYDETGFQTKFDNVNVYRGDGSAWGYDNLVNAEQKTWEFAAYSNGGVEGKGFGKLENTKVAYNYTDADNQTLTVTDYETTENKDLVVAFNHDVVDGNTNKVASFNFRHALAQVKFTIQSALGNNDITITDFSVTGFQNKGTLTFTKSDTYATDLIKWASLADAKTIDKLDNDVATTAQSASGTYVIIPQNHTNLTSNKLVVTFKATLVNHPDGNTKTKTFTVEITDQNSLKFKEGYRYNFIATIDGNDMDVISFDKPVVTEWIDNTPDFDINN